MNDEKRRFIMTHLFSCECRFIAAFGLFWLLVFKGKFTPEGCNIVLDIIEYKLDLPEVEEYD